METQLSDLRLERETTIVFNEAEPLAMVWSASPTFQRRMAKAGIEPVRKTERERGAIACWYEVPRQWVRVRKPVVKQITEEQRLAMSERAKMRLGRR